MLEKQTAGAITRCVMKPEKIFFDYCSSYIPWRLSFTCSPNPSIFLFPSFFFHSSYLCICTLSLSLYSIFRFICPFVFLSLYRSFFLSLCIFSALDFLSLSRPFFLSIFLSLHVSFLILFKLSFPLSFHFFTHFFLLFSPTCCFSFYSPCFFFSLSLPLFLSFNLSFQLSILFSLPILFFSSLFFFLSLSFS